MWNFYFIYTNLYISEKSSLSKVFCTLWDIIIFHGDSATPHLTILHSRIWGSRPHPPPGLTPMPLGITEETINVKLYQW